MSRIIGGIASPRARVTTEASLGNGSIGVTAEGYPHMFQLYDSGGSLLHQNLNGILVSQIIAPFHCIEHMEFPVVVALISQRSRYPSLSAA